MNRYVLIELFRRGMRYPAGTRRTVKLTRWFDIVVQPSQHVEITEYEDTAVELAAVDVPSGRRIGRTLLNLRTSQIVEDSGGERA